MGCGSGRWARLVASRVGKLNCIDPSSALDVAQRRLSDFNNVTCLRASVDAPGLPLESQDFGYSLGVLHHVPDTGAAIRSCVSLLKPGAPFLLYLYYSFDNRPLWFRAIWLMSDTIRKVICRLPPRLKHLVTDLIASVVYFPLARLSNALELLKIPVELIPLSLYRHLSFYTMRTDARDRFGTPLEQRFSRSEIESMMRDAGLVEIRFSDSWPYWCAVGLKS